MESTKLMSFIAVSLLVSLQLPAQLSAQRNADENHSHPQYKLVDMERSAAPTAISFLIRSLKV